MSSHAVRLTEFLVRRVDERYGHACLTHELELDPRAVREALVRVSAEIVLDRGTSACSGCGQRTLVVGCTAASTDPVEDRMMAFLGVARRRTTGVCHTCIARHVGLTYEEVRKVVSRLR